MTTECWVMAYDEGHLTGAHRLAFLAIGDCDGLVGYASISRWTNIEDPDRIAEIVLDLRDWGYLDMVDGRLVCESMVGASIPSTASWRERQTGKRRSVFEAADWKCVYCGSEEDLTIDHIIPKSRGGSNDISNLAAACHRCNCEKGAKPVDEFMSQLKDRADALS